MCFHSSERHRRHICSPLFRSQYTIHTGKRMKITTSRDRRFRNEFFMLARLSRDTDTSIHAHTQTYSYKHERIHTSTLNCSNEYAFFRRFASKTFGRIPSPKKKRKLCIRHYTRPAEFGGICAIHGHFSMAMVTSNESSVRIHNPHKDLQVVSIYLIVCCSGLKTQTLTLTQ